MNKIKVLLIEDDRSISNFITATMDREGYKIMHALNGREGLSLSTSFCPNVILLDLGLPDMDGLEVLQKLRSWSTKLSSSSIYLQHPVHSYLEKC